VNLCRAALGASYRIVCRTVGQSHLGKRAAQFSGTTCAHWSAAVRTEPRIRCQPGSALLAKCHLLTRFLRLFLSGPGYLFGFLSENQGRTPSSPKTTSYFGTAGFFFALRFGRFETVCFFGISSPWRESYHRARVYPTAIIGLLLARVAGASARETVHAARDLRHRTRGHRRRFSASRSGPCSAGRRSASPKLIQAARRSRSLRKSSSRACAERNQKARQKRPNCTSGRKRG
jgi:hypothetical protein